MDPAEVQPAEGSWPAPDVGIIGGSGFYEFLSDAREVSVETPYGPPAGPIMLGRVGERTAAFIARHGTRHQFAPSEVPYRANLWALRALGVTRVLAPCAVGSLRADAGPGDLVVLDQLVDRTWGRPDTFVTGPGVDHVGFADPYCPDLSAVVCRTADQAEAWPAGRVFPTGTVVVIQGPRFSTRAESKFYAGAGFDVINMTQYPEAYLARELGLCYAGLALVTDRDVGVEGDPGAPPVTMQAAMAVLAANVAHSRTLLKSVIEALSDGRDCGCAAGGAPSLRA